MIKFTKCPFTIAMVYQLSVHKLKGKLILQFLSYICQRRIEYCYSDSEQSQTEIISSLIKNIDTVQ